jgi:hypothetical protein
MSIFGIDGRKQPARLTPHDMNLSEVELQKLAVTYSREAEGLFQKGHIVAANARLDYRSAIFDRIADFQD